MTKHPGDLQGLKARRRFDGRYLLAWLQTIARNTALDLLRRRKLLADDPEAWLAAGPETGEKGCRRGPPADNFRPTTQRCCVSGSPRTGASTRSQSTSALPSTIRRRSSASSTAPAPCSVPMSRPSLAAA